MAEHTERRRRTPESSLISIPHIAIAGASGRLGNAAVRVGLEAGINTTALQHIKQVSKYEGLQGTVKGFDVTDPESVNRSVKRLRDNGVKTVINATGVLSLDASEETRGNPDSQMYKVHVKGARNLAEACKKYGLKMIHLSTEYVFTGDKPFGETYNVDDEPNVTLDGPNRNPTWYGLTKALGEKEVLDVFKDQPDGLVIARIAQVQVPKSGLFAATVIEMKGKNAFTRVSDQLASPITDVTAIEALHKIAQAMHDPNREIGQIYHIGATNAKTPYEISQLLTRESGWGERAEKVMEPTTLRELVASGQQAVERPKNTTLAVDKFEDEFGELPSIEQEIERYTKLNPPNDAFHIHGLPTAPWKPLGKIIDVPLPSKEMLAYMEKQDPVEFRRLTLHLLTTRVVAGVLIDAIEEANQSKPPAEQMPIDRDVILETMIAYHASRPIADYAAKALSSDAANQFIEDHSDIELAEREALINRLPLPVIKTIETIGKLKPNVDVEMVLGSEKPGYPKIDMNAGLALLASWHVAGTIVPFEAKREDILSRHADNEESPKKYSRKDLEAQLDWGDARLNDICKHIGIRREEYDGWLKIKLHAGDHEIDPDQQSVDLILELFGKKRRGYLPISHAYRDLAQKIMGKKEGLERDLANPTRILDILVRRGNLRKEGDIYVSADAT